MPWTMATHSFVFLTQQATGTKKPKQPLRLFQMCFTGKEEPPVK